MPGGTVVHVASGVETPRRSWPTCAATPPGRRITRSSTGPRVPARWNATSPPTTWPQSARLRAHVGREDGIRRTWQWFTDSVFPARTTFSRSPECCGG